MDINVDLAAVSQRIAEISGGPVPGMPGFSSDAGASSFSQMVQSAMGTQPGPTLGRVVVPSAQIDKLVSANAANWNVDPDLVKAVIANESGFNANATSSTGAQGLMQLEPATAASVGVTDPYDPAQNVAGGTRYLRGLLDRFHNDPRLAVAAYNAGPGAVEKYNGVPPYAETQNYVQNVLASYAKYRAVRAGSAGH
jgi:soluble lytic murein transglycosylase-like protein